jgi:quercetin dioxygenase-like cupin family protein
MIIEKKSPVIDLTDKRNAVAIVEVSKPTVHVMAEIIEYLPHSIIGKTVIQKTAGNIPVSSFAIGEEMAEKSSLFDTYIQIIDGSAELFVRGQKYKLGLGDGMVIPTHSSHWFNANKQFKIISTVIKRGYE